MRMDIPEKYRSCTLETFKAVSLGQRRALKAVTLFVKQPKGWVYLFGPPGVGKTHLLVSAGKALGVCLKCMADPESAGDDLPFHFEERDDMSGKKRQIVVKHNAPTLLNHLDLLSNLKGAIGSKRGRYEDVLSDVKDAKILLLDDLGIERQTEFSMEIVTAIIMARYDAELPTMFTSNKGLSELAVLYDDRIASRIHGMCQPSGIVEVTGNDARMRAS